MGILTILKANIKHGKGAFASIIILMMIVILAFTTIISIKDNCESSIIKAYDSSGAGQITAALKEEDLTDEMLNSIRNNSDVDHVTVTEGVFSDRLTVGDEKSENPWLLCSFDSSKVKVFNKSTNGYERSPSVPDKGEIYISQGAGNYLKCRIGDTINMSVAGDNYELKIKGFVEDPIYGVSMLPLKRAYLNNDDLTNMRKKAETSEYGLGKAAYIDIYKSDNSSFSDEELQTKLNEATGIIDYSIMSMTKSMAVFSAKSIPTIIMTFMVAFVIVLIIVVLIIMGNSVSASIEMNYTDLGIMKSQGFSNGKIRYIYILQNILAELVGAIIGLILSIPFMMAFGNIFQPLTSVLSEKSVSWGKVLLLISVLELFSVAFILYQTRKVGKVAPVVAITGKGEIVKYDNSFRTPISKKNLSLSLALRQFASCKRRYSASIVVASCLVFFLITIIGFGSSLSSKSALENMNGIYYELSIDFKEEAPDEKLLEDIDSMVEKESSIEKKFYMTEKSASIEGNTVNMMIYQNDIDISVYKGRMPKYENEVLINDLYVEEHNTKVGDKVVISYMGKNSEYIVSGFFKNKYNVGMRLDGGKKIGIDSVDKANYSLRTPEKSSEIAAAVNSRYGERLKADGDIDNGEEMINTALGAMRMIILIFSVIFAFVTVSMVCSKAFIQEKTDIGIYKAVGLRTESLRLQFALRFLIVAVIGSFLGTLMSLFLSDRFILLILSSLGIDEFAFPFGFVTVVIPVLLVCVCFFVFAYFISRKVKKVEVKDLVTE